MAFHNEVGKWGEEVAASFLREKGYVILERDWHSGHRDIDIIARDGDVVVFVEVKTRSKNYLMSPLSAIDYEKIRNLKLAANHYIKYRYLDNEFRFDTVTIVGNMGDFDIEIEHIEGAFR